MNMNECKVAVEWCCHRVILSPQSVVLYICLAFQTALELIKINFIASSAGLEVKIDRSNSNRPQSAAHLSIVTCARLFYTPSVDCSPSSTQLWIVNKHVAVRASFPSSAVINSCDCAKKLVSVSPTFRTLWCFHPHKLLCPEKRRETERYSCLPFAMIK